MEEQRHAKLLDIVVERLEPLGIDARIIADAARQVDAHQAELVDRVIDDVDRSLRVDQRYRGTRPDAAGMGALCPRHLFMPLGREIATHYLFQGGEGDRERADRADDVDLMTEAVHMSELLV